MNRIMFAVFSCIVLLAGYFIYDIYKKNIGYAEEKVLAQLTAIAKSISLEIDPEAFKYLIDQYPGKDDIKENTQDSAYNKLHHFLAAQGRINALESPIYLLTFNNLSQKFEFIVTSAENPYFRHTYSQIPPVLREKYHVGGYIPTMKLKTADGYRLSHLLKATAVRLLV